MAFAVLGDSFISRLEGYVHSERHPAKRYSYFGVPAMSTHRKFETAFLRMKVYNPKGKCNTFN